MLYIIERGKFNGSCVSSITGGYVDFSGYLHNDKGPDLTFEQYKALPCNEGRDLIAVEYEEILALRDEWERVNYLDQPAKEITEEQFYDALDVLPPMRWKRTGAFESFCMMERITGNLTTQYARYIDRYLSKVIDLTKPETEITPAMF